MKFWDNTKQRIVNHLLKSLLSAITIKDIVSNDPKTGVVLIDGQVITSNELKQLKAEIKAIEGFRVWHLMSETTKHKAENMIFNESIVVDDIRFGKAMLYNLSLQRSILKAIKAKNL